MAQNSKVQKSKRAPAYSADSLAVHLLLGLILVALGLLIAFAVILNAPGSVFAGIRQLSRGLTGSLAFLFPVLPVWGGVLVLMSVQRKPRIFPFIMACVMYLMLLTTAIFFSYSGNPAMPLMEYIRQDTRSESFENFLAWIYVKDADLLKGGRFGGVLGMLLAWPLWKTVGVIPGVVITVLGILLSGMLMLHITPARIRELMGKMSVSRQERQARRQQEAYQKDLEWKQQQAILAQQQQQQMQMQQWMQQQSAMQAQAQRAQQSAPPPQQPVYQEPYPDPVPTQPLPSQEMQQERSPYAPPEAPPAPQKKNRKAR